MTATTLKLNWIEKTKITKFAEGVDPHDPNSVPYEVIESSRELSGAETEKVVKLVESMKVGGISELDATIARKREQIKKLNAAFVEKPKKVK